MGGKGVMGVNSRGIRYVSMSQRQQQHRAVQQAVRHVSPVSSLLLSSTTYTGDRKSEREVQGEKENRARKWVDKVIQRRREKNGRQF